MCQAFLCFAISLLFWFRISRQQSCSLVPCECEICAQRKQQQIDRLYLPFSRTAL
jgi:hypothetical protein